MLSLLVIRYLKRYY